MIPNIPVGRNRNGPSHLNSNRNFRNLWHNGKHPNNYNTDFIERNTYNRPNNSSNNSYTTTATIPYIRGTSETIARILRPYNIRVAHKPIFTLRRLLTHVKGKDKPEDRPGAVYKIHCSDCQATYIGETQKLNHATNRTQTSYQKG